MGREIKDQMVLGRCANKIKEYLDKLNLEDTKDWTAKEVVQFINTNNTKIPFVPFCNTFIDNMINDNRERTAKNYRIALIALCLNHSSKYKTTELYFDKIFTPINELNNKVLDFIFYNKKKGKNNR